MNKFLLWNAVNGFPLARLLLDMPGSLVLLLLSTLLAIFRCTAITISNTSPRRNATGAIIDAHDGSYQQWGGPGTPFYYYAMGYAACK